MWMWKKEKKELENAINDLKVSIKNLRGELENSKVLQERNYRPYSLFLDEDYGPISLIELKTQINGIKDFLGIEFVVEPSTPSRSYMKKTPVVEDSTCP